MRKTLRQTKHRFKTLFSHPLFWTLTVVGNSIMFLGSFLLWTFESTREAPISYLDCLLWSAGTVTTIGYGNLTPLTLAGKLTLLCLMLLGTLFVWSYMGFLVTGLIAPELASLEKDVRDMEKEVHELRTSTKDEKEIFI